MTIDRRAFHNDTSIPNLSALRRPSVGAVLSVLKVGAAAGFSDWREVVRAAARCGVLSLLEAKHAVGAEQETAFFSQAWVGLTGGAQ